MKPLSVHKWLQRALLVACLASVSPVLGGAAPRRISGQFEGNCYNPAISPDGTRVAYEVNFFERRVIELYIYDLTTGKEVQVQASKGGSAVLTNFGVQGGGKQVTYELAWSPNRPKWFVFSSSGGDENYDLYLSTGGLLASDPAADGMAAWSADGQLIAFTSARSNEGDLYLVDINNADAKPNPITRYVGSTEWYPVWHPKHRSLLFVRHNSKGGDNIFMMGDVANPRDTTFALTEWNSIQTKPSWSPDGSRLAFYSNKESKDRYDLYVMDAAKGAVPKRIMSGVIPNERLGPAWAPDGKGILVVKDDPERFNPIRLVSVTDPNQVKIVPTGTQNNGDIQLVVPPNKGPQIAFTAQGRIGDSVKSFKRVYVYTPEPAELSF